MIMEREAAGTLIKALFKEHGSRCAFAVIVRQPHGVRRKICRVANFPTPEGTLIMEREAQRVAIVAKIGKNCSCYRGALHPRL